MVIDIIAVILFYALLFMVTYIIAVILFYALLMGIDTVREDRKAKKAKKGAKK